ncbi:MAG: hypothetical protein J2P45_32040, partial [Candidatus Dormibacteraeota bacterium]|nr:hypothetical protein [Candidatus Dormibacteraeota bacterium]
RFSDSQWQRSPDPTWHDRSGDEGVVVLVPPRGPVSYRWPGPKTGPTTWASLLVTCVAEPC